MVRTGRTHIFLVNASVLSGGQADLRAGGCLRLRTSRRSRPSASLTSAPLEGASGVAPPNAREGTPT